MLRIALRAHVTGFLVTGTLGFVTVLTETAGFAAGAGHTAAERAAFGQQMQAFAAQIAYLLPLPVHPETIGGYIQWRGYGVMPVIVGFWAVMAATGAIRNEEERGLLELWLASGAGRLRLIGARCAAFTAAALAVVLLTALGGLAGAAWVGESLDLIGLAQVSLALCGITLACFAIGLAAAQLAISRRAAAGLAGIVLLALFLLDSLGRVRHDLSGWARVSPFALFDSTTALAPGGSFDVAATVALFAIAVVLVFLSAVAFWRRDLWASLLPRRPVMEQARRTPSANPLLRVPVLSALYEQRIAVLAWSVGTMLTATYMIALAKSFASLIAGNVAFQAYFRGTGTSDPVLLLLGLFWFGIAALLVVAYAITQVARWAADDSEGRLEMILAQPMPRWRVVAERGLALIAVAALLSALGLLVVAVGAPSQGIHVNGGRLVLATALLVPLGVMFGAVGSAVIARLPGLAVGVLSAIAVIGYLLTQFGPLFRWPDWVLDLSVFRLYGTPLTSGVYWTGLYAMVAVVVVGFGIGLIAMRFREVGR